MGDTISDEIFRSVTAAMAAAEGIHGPEGADYLALMKRIADEAMRRHVAVDIKKPWEHHDNVGAFFAAFPSINGWEVDWEYPGYACWTWAAGGHEYEVHATPDHEPEPTDPDGFVGVEVYRVTGRDRGCVHAVVLPWPYEGRTVESFRALLGPVLDKFAPMYETTVDLVVQMRPPKRGELGYFTTKRGADGAAEEILREIRDNGEVGWIATREISPGPDDEGLVPCTIILRSLPSRVVCAADAVPPPCDNCEAKYSAHRDGDEACPDTADLNQRYALPGDQ